MASVERLPSLTDQEQQKLLEEKRRIAFSIIRLFLSEVARFHKPRYAAIDKEKGWFGYVFDASDMAYQLFLAVQIQLQQMPELEQYFAMEEQQSHSISRYSIHWNYMSLKSLIPAKKNRRPGKGA